ncbi:MAG: hypothetical protein OEZ30_10425 [Candidatus Aminicenantes bacterium]|nr:hypothetical protein [Candidatus Aminicenantes bacterium]
MKEKDKLKSVVEKGGGSFSRFLGIELRSGKSEEIFKWFLASILFGARIGEGIAIKTYEEFDRRGVITPQSILETGWDGLVEILDAGAYVRYDFKTATKLLAVMGTLVEMYEGDLNRLHLQASDSGDLENRLIDLGNGIGKVTVNIFLRELRGVWDKAQPQLQDLALLSARRLGLLPTTPPGEPLTSLMEEWVSQGGSEVDFPSLESSLVRLAKNYCRHERCSPCPAAELCPHRLSKGAK